MSEMLDDFIIRVDQFANLKTLESKSFCTFLNKFRRMISTHHTVMPVLQKLEGKVQYMDG